MDLIFSRAEIIGFIKRSSYGSDILRSRSDGLPAEFGAKAGWWHVSVNVKGVECQKIKYFRFTLTKKFKAASCVIFLHEQNKRF